MELGRWLAGIALLALWLVLGSLIALAAMSSLYGTGAILFSVMIGLPLALATDRWERGQFPQKAPRTVLLWTPMLIIAAGALALWWQTNESVWVALYIVGLVFVVPFYAYAVPSNIRRIAIAWPPRPAAVGTPRFALSILGIVCAIALASAFVARNGLLRLASARGQTHLAAMMLLVGADPSEPLAIAVGRGHDDVVAILLGHGGRIDPDLLSFAAFQNRPAICKRLIAAGADINGGLDAPILRAVEGRAAAVVDLLIEAGADVNRRSPAGWTPLMIAAKQRDITIASRLIAAGADPNARDREGATALDHAITDSDREIESFLRAHMPR